jgi:hypothetical protein
MTNQRISATEIDPDAYCREHGCPRATCDESHVEIHPDLVRATIAATLRTTNRLDVAALISVLRATGREELIHYAGAAHRDPVAWQMCVSYLADPEAGEAVLKSRALKAAWGVDVSPAQLVR